MKDYINNIEIMSAQQKLWGSIPVGKKSKGVKIFGAYFRRMRARLGAPKAITAAAHKLARILYAMLKERKSFLEVGQDAYEQAYEERQLRSLKKRARELGFNLVTC